MKNNLNFVKLSFNNKMFKVKWTSLAAKLLIVNFPNYSVYRLNEKFVKSTSYYLGAKDFIIGEAPLNMLKFKKHWKNLQLNDYKCSNRECNSVVFKNLVSLQESNLTKNLYYITLQPISENGVIFTRDHILPVSKGGKNKFDNIRIMCENCNKELGNSQIY